jgi:hypothetical protein
MRLGRKFEETASCDMECQMLLDVSEQEGLTKPGNMRRNELKDVQRSQFLFSCSSLTPVLGQRKEL